MIRLCFHCSVTTAIHFFSSCKTNSVRASQCPENVSPYPSALKTCIVLSSQYNTAALCLRAKLQGRKPIFLKETTTGNIISYSKYMTKVLHEKRTLYTYNITYIIYDSYFQTECFITHVIRPHVISPHSL